jgi:hypothetical protein
MFILVYVDYIIVASSTSEGVTTLLQDLKKVFSLKDLGGLHYFLGIEVNKIRDGLDPGEVCCLSTKEICYGKLQTYEYTLMH